MPQAQTAIALLDRIFWLPDPPSCPDNAMRDWLLERGSMTRRLEAYCGQIRVQRFREGFVSSDILGDAAAFLPPDDRLWLREVVLYGDTRPWLVGRTLVPAQAAAGFIQKLIDLGDMPLGRWIFAHQAPERDFIQFGRTNALWARRSRLRVEGSCLLLTELFLPDSPFYNGHDNRF